MDVVNRGRLASFARGRGLQSCSLVCTAWTHGLGRPHDSRVRVLAHIKKLDDCFGQSRCA